MPKITTHVPPNNPAHLDGAMTYATRDPQHPHNLPVRVLVAIRHASSKLYDLTLKEGEVGQLGIPWQDVRHTRPIMHHCLWRPNHTSFRTGDTLYHPRLGPTRDRWHAAEGRSSCMGT